MEMPISRVGNLRIVYDFGPSSDMYGQKLNIPGGMMKILESISRMFPAKDTPETCILSPRANGSWGMIFVWGYLVWLDVLENLQSSPSLEVYCDGDSEYVTEPYSVTFAAPGMKTVGDSGLTPLQDLYWKLGLGHSREVFSDHNRVIEYIVWLIATVNTLYTITHHSPENEDM